MVWNSSLSFSILILILSATLSVDGKALKSPLIHDVVVQIAEGEQVARQVANETSFKYIKQMRAFPDFYVFGPMNDSDLNKLSKHSKVRWMEVQVPVENDELKTETETETPPEEQAKQ